MKFEYQALDCNGELTSGSEEADSFKEFIAILFHKNLRPFDIRRVTNSRQKTFNELEYLKKLRGKIQGDPEMPEDDLETLKPTRKKFKLNLKIDYAYLVYLMIITALIVVAATHGL